MITFRLYWYYLKNTFKRNWLRILFVLSVCWITSFAWPLVFFMLDRNKKTMMISRPYDKKQDKFGTHNFSFMDFTQLEFVNFSKRNQLCYRGFDKKEPNATTFSRFNYSKKLFEYINEAKVNIKEYIEDKRVLESDLENILNQLRNNKEAKEKKKISVEEFKKKESKIQQEINRLDIRKNIEKLQNKIAGSLYEINQLEVEFENVFGAIVPYGFVQGNFFAHTIDIFSLMLGEYEIWKIKDMFREFFSRDIGDWLAKTIKKSLPDIVLEQLVNATWWIFFKGFTLYFLTLPILNYLFCDLKKKGEDGMVLTTVPGVKRKDIFICKTLVFLTYLSTMCFVTLVFPYSFAWILYGAKMPFTNFLFFSLFVLIVAPIILTLFFFVYVHLKNLYPLLADFLSFIFVFGPIFFDFFIKPFYFSLWMFQLREFIFSPIRLLFTLTIVGIFFTLLHYGYYKKEDLND